MTTSTEPAGRDKPAARKPKTKPVMPHLSIAERVARGKAARAEVPRSSHAKFEPVAARPDPIDLLERQAKTRVPELVPIRYGRMMVSSFTFYRGAALIMAHDLAATPRSGLNVQICGDAHLSNFGVFGSPERVLVFDVNDFDETLPGPWEWDVKRLSVSMLIAARANGYRVKDQERIVLDTVNQYRTAMANFAGMKNLDVWYSHLDIEQVLKEYAPQFKARMVKRADKNLAKARTKDSMAAFSKLVNVTDGHPAPTPTCSPARPPARSRGSPTTRPDWSWRAVASWPGTRSRARCGGCARGSSWRPTPWPRRGGLPTSSTPTTPVGSWWTPRQSLRAAAGRRLERTASGGRSASTATSRAQQRVHHRQPAALAGVAGGTTTTSTTPLPTRPPSRSPPRAPWWRRRRCRRGGARSRRRGHRRVIAPAGSFAAAAVAHHEGRQVWMAAGVGRYLPRRGCGTACEHGLDAMGEPWERGFEVVPSAPREPRGRPGRARVPGRRRASHRLPGRPRAAPRLISPCSGAWPTRRWRGCTGATPGVVVAAPVVDVGPAAVVVVVVVVVGDVGVRSGGIGAAAGTRCRRPAGPAPAATAGRGTRGARSRASRAGCRRWRRGRSSRRGSTSSR